VTFQNTSRGVLLLEVSIEKPKNGPAWIALQAGEAGLPVYLRAGDNQVSKATRQFLLQDLAEPGYEQTFRCQLQIARRRASGEQPVISRHAVTVTTLPYRQGFRRYLWLWGLRGGLPGFVWHMFAGALLAGGVRWCILAWVPETLPDAVLSVVPTFAPFLQALLGGIAFVLTGLPGGLFVWLAGGVTGCIGGVSGFRQGHTDYPANQQKAEIQAQGKGWAILLFLGLGIWQYNVTPLPPFVSEDLFPLVLALISLISGCLLCSLLLLLVLTLVVFVRLGLENILRQRYRALLKPQGGL
jgi:hypothetical protein